MNTPIAPVPAPPEPPKPVIPPEPISGKKIALYLVIGLFAIVGITLAAWEEGRVNLGASFGMKGFKRRQADCAAANSNGNKPNYTEAFRLYQQDADKGDGEALRKIGEMYRDGRGVPQSDAKARESWNKAAASGDVGTLIWLSEKYRVGDGRAMQVNHPESLRLLRRAGSQGDALAQAKLARQLLAYVAEYQMKLDFDEVLSARQKEELLSLPKVRDLLKANADGSLEKMSRGALQGMVASAVAEVGETLREKFQWEAYFWLSLAAASNDEAELRGLRDGVASKLKDKQVERVQGLVAKWSQSDAPGVADSPFVLDEGPVVEVPDAPKQTLSALLQEISAKAAKLPDGPAGVPVVPAEPTSPESRIPGRAATTIPAQPKVIVPAERPVSLAATLGSLVSNDEAIAETKAYVAAMYDTQINMAVRRNILLAFPQNTMYLRISKNYYMAGVEVYACYTKINSLRASAKNVHPSVLQYSDALNNLLVGRLNYIRKLQLKSAEIANGQAYSNEFNAIMEQYIAFDRDELAKTNLAEAVMVKKLGDDYSISPPERSAAYAEAQKNHEQRVLQVLSSTPSKDIYTLLVGTKLDTWTFEEGEYRDSRRDMPAVEASGRIAMPFTVSVVGRSTGVSHVFKLTLYFSINGNGRLELIGVL
jgi:hypothetical protein